MSTDLALSAPPTLHMKRFLMCHENRYADEFPRLFGHVPYGEGVLFGNGVVVVEIKGNTYQYGSLEELFRTFVQSGTLMLTWLDGDGVNA